MSKAFNRGDAVYSIEGQRGEYVAAAPHSGHIVLPLFEGAIDEGDFYGEPAAWPMVFAEPPRPKLDAEIAEQQQRLAQLQEEVRKARAEQRELQQDERARRARLAEHRGLQQIDDFLAGRITHFVKVSHYYPPVVETFDNVMVREERRSGRELRLLGLFGDETRGLKWKVTPYGDGSGNTTDEVIPCTSLEQAQDRQADLIAASWDGIRSGRGYNAVLCGTVDLARERGLPVPQDLADKADEVRRAGAAGTLKTRREEFARAQQQLQAAEAAARATGLQVTEGGA